jgi:hypothetical protein
MSFPLQLSLVQSATFLQHFVADAVAIIGTMVRDIVCTKLGSFINVSATQDLVFGYSSFISSLLSWLTVSFIRPGRLIDRVYKLHGRICSHWLSERCYRMLHVYVIAPLE